ncbi:hypothetical protein E2C01_066226 [Portunus trituberculatus]|uniref:Uncharacterized protein n=1 Tax=Portunus trituberculatus TaxID=210409 RepID=A0A5B7HU42_PORTR|nr:hypothetical protein [Portunus trituberculatus]
MASAASSERLVVTSPPLAGCITRVGREKEAEISNSRRALGDETTRRRDQETKRRGDEYSRRGSETGHCWC